MACKSLLLLFKIQGAKFKRKSIIYFIIIYRDLSIASTSLAVNLPRSCSSRRGCGGWNL